MGENDKLCPEQTEKLGTFSYETKKKVLLHSLRLFKKSDIAVLKGTV